MSTPRCDCSETEGIILGDASCSAVRVLRLTLKRKWFDMVANGEKKEEYRQPSKWILSRLENKEYDRVEFKNGYGYERTIRVFCGVVAWTFFIWKSLMKTI